MRNIHEHSDGVMEIDEEDEDEPILLDAISHIFLPKRTPDRIEPQYQETVEQFILQSVKLSVSNAIQESGFSELDEVLKMMHWWVDHQPYTNSVGGPSDEINFPKNFSQAVSSSTAFTTIPIYIRKQNSTILIDKQEDGSIRVETFRASLPSKLVMSTVGALTMHFPETSDIVQNRDLLTSQIFAKSLHELTVQKLDISTPVNQLSGQCDDVAEPFLIQDWIMTLLSPTNGESSLAEHHKICKKIRDQVTFTSDRVPPDTLPFRRSGMWMSIKVVLQLKLLKLFLGDENTARTVYKLLLLHIHADLSQQLYDRKTPLDVDLAAQMLAKIGRRFHKFFKLAPPTESITTKTGSFSTSSMKTEVLRARVLNHVMGVVSNLNRDMVKTSLNDLKDAGSRQQKLRNRSKDSFLLDLEHSIPFLTSYKEDIPSEIKAVADSTPEQLMKSMELERYLTTDKILIGAQLFWGGHCNMKERVWLYDTETFIKTQLQVEKDTSKILNLVQTNVKHALTFYKGNPLGTSQMVLVVLKAVEVLDIKAAQAFPLLLDYKCGVNRKAFDCLILPHGDDMQLLKDALDYFQRRDLNAKVDQSILISNGHHITQDSFSVQLASQNHDMIKLRNDILQKTEENIANRLTQIESAREECRGILCQIEMVKKNTETGKLSFEQFVSQAASLETKVMKIRTQFPLFERPLPEEEYLRNVVIFEVRIPQQISSLRECLALLKFDILEEPTQRNSLPVKWLDYQNLTKYLPSQYRNTREDTAIILWSSRMNLAKSFHLKENSDIMCCTDNLLSWQNGMKCSYTYQSILPEPLKNLAAHCTFKIKDTDNSQTYLDLQKYLESTTHSQNDVIANQLDCHDNLTFDEFLTFGSLRAGSRIQLRNMYRALVSKQLSFEEEPVLALILQTIWQTGPYDNKTGEWESHLDFLDDGFCSTMVEVLEELVKTNETSYGNPLILMTAVVITLRILELNDKVFEKCIRLLRTCRGILRRWSRKIENAIQKERSPNELKALQRNLLLVCSCSVFSYNFSSSFKWDKVMQDEEDIINWFQAICDLNQQEDLVAASSPSLSGFMQLLLNCAKQAPLRLQLELHLLNNPILHKSLRAFTSEKCSKVQHCLAARYPDHGLPKIQGNIVQLHYVDEQAPQMMQSLTITFHLILGTFLVNGFREADLSPDVTRTSLFQRFFGANTHLRVQRESAMVSRTLNKFHGKHYEFRLSKNTNTFGTLADAVIDEIWEDGTRLTLLKPEEFSDELPTKLINDFTHWFDVKRSILYFRRMRMPRQDSDYDFPPEYNLVKKGDSDKWLLHDVGNHCYMHSIHSGVFLDITAAFSKLELKEHIKVVLDMGIEVLTAHLPRYNLQFKMSGGLMECVQYPGFYLDDTPSHYPRTLLGLQQCLHLKSNSRRLLIVPHGRLSLAPSGDKSSPLKSLCMIDLKELRQPPYFKYEYDEVLNRLVADKSKTAWLYLAALHAATSSPLPDRFTGLTGTESAVRILQSGFVWSSSPYDVDSLKILYFIKSLAPRRKYCERGFPTGSVELIEWPWGGLFPTMAAFDGYAIIVDKLIEDSQRLETLHYVGKSGNQETTSGELQTVDILLLRSYFRHLGSYNDAGFVRSHYFQSSLQKIVNRGDKDTLVTSTKSAGLNLNGVAFLASSSHLPDSLLIQSNSNSFQKDSLIQFLLSKQKPPVPLTGLPTSVKDMLQMGTTFKQSWFSLYNLAMKQGRSDEENHLLTMILTALALQDVPFTQLQNLLYLSTLADEVDFPIPPKELLAHLNSSPEHFRHHTDDEEYSRNRGQAARDIRRRYWPCTSIPLTEAKCVESLIVRHFQFIRYPEGLVSLINSKFHDWEYWSTELTKFVQDVQSKLNEVHDALEVQVEVISTTDPTVSVVKLGKVDWDLRAGLDSLFETAQLNQQLWDEAKRYGRTGKISSHPSGAKRDADGELKFDLAWHWKQVHDIMQNMRNMLNGNPVGRVLGLTGICPRMDPVSLLTNLIHSQPDLKLGICRNYTGGLAVLFTHIKRLNRCIAYQALGLAADIQRELGNAGHFNWKPEESPEWLLLELELDIMIRPIQVDVARQMIEMRNEKNGVMQLNMGEGKTSVIVPMMCAVLGKQENMLCRLTVLGSMFNMNYRILSFAIGGLLNQRLYSFPCKRDMEIDGGCADAIQNSYEECMKLGGVVITQPDYRLSFRLLTYDKILKNEVDLGLKLWRTENWLRGHVRDILDESDELLNVKYQLVYTVGGQVPLDGGELRWTTCQRLLQIVQQVVKEFLSKYGPGALELHEEEWNSNPHQFTPIRLLDSVIYPEFASAVADLILHDVIGTKLEKRKLKQFLVQPQNMGKDELEDALDSVKDVPELLIKILVASGYLGRGVLTLGLSKRWRVDYGVDSSKHFRQMAVPFRAKDVPAEKAEFGHPDLAILLTHLSYYYSGLSDEQLGETFQLLKIKQGPESLYGSWIQQIPVDQVPGYLSSYRGLNLKDSFQKSKLFELLRKHTLVIDYWLSNKVLPREAKQFHSKLVMTSWDLCYERGEHPITGFSGTNDSSVLLPLAIQQDLPLLSSTNKKVEGVLLQPENRGNRKLKMGVTCLEILQLMKVDGLTVLIDAGALMLDCDNEQVAATWLLVDEGIETVLYFNGNALFVKCRSGQGDSKDQDKDTPFELSPYQGRLEKCGVFLDDQHTRGTDLKFSIGTKACATVGGRMKRDKLIQACMRMRGLGRGHSVMFYLSHEAYDKVAKQAESVKSMNMEASIATKDILEWTRTNTDNFNKDGLLYWAIAGKNYAQRLAAEDNFYLKASPNNINSAGAAEPNFLDLVGDAQVLAEQCVDDEITKLMDCYGQHMTLDLLVNVIKKWFEAAMDTLTRKNKGQQVPLQISEYFEGIRDKIIQRCQQHIPTKTHVSGTNMEEEQERELEIEKEMEVEEEREIAQRVKAEAAKNSLHKNVFGVVVKGEALQIKDGIMRLCDMFKDTTFWGDVQPDGWGNEVFATKDFVTVISQRFGWTDKFIRPVEWVVSVQGKHGLNHLLVLSPFEVNELMPSFRKKKLSRPIHMFSLRRSATQDFLLKESRLMLPVRGNHLQIPDGSNSISALLLASGNLYFGSMTEQEAFARYLCLAPQPWSEEEKEAFEKQLITKTGFMLHQQRADGSHGFGKDPSELVRMILRCRHLLLSDKAHVVQLLDEKRYVMIGCYKDGGEVDNVMEVDGNGE